MIDVVQGEEIVIPDLIRDLTKWVQKVTCLRRSGFAQAGMLKRVQGNLAMVACREGKALST